MIASSAAMHSAAPTAPLAESDLEAIRDWYVFERPGEPIATEVDSAFCFRGGDPERLAVADSAVAPWLERLLAHIRCEHPSERGEVEFRVEANGVLFRANRGPTVRGTLLNLRRLPPKAPQLADLTMPPYWRELLLWERLQSGGMVILAAAMGQGKSTTLAAAVRSRLLQYAGFCLAIEDPPEIPLDGGHGRGECVQVPVAALGGSYHTAIKRSLRQFPSLSKGGGMLLVGEVRDGESASELVRAAVNGTLVFTTIHASDPKTAVARLSALAAQTIGREAANDLVASAIRLVFHQRLTMLPHESGWRRGRLGGEVLINPHDASPAANNIRDGQFAQLNHTLAAQSRILGRPHRPPFIEIAKEL